MWLADPRQSAWSARLCGPCAGVVRPRAMCQIRTAAGAAAYDRGDRQALRPGHPPSLIQAIRKRLNRTKYP
jgi:hypothetical protein